LILQMRKKNKDKTKLEINFHCKTQFGPWKFKKPYSEVWKFVTTLNKTYSKKELSKLASKQEKIEGEFLKGNNDKLIGYLKEIFTIVGNNKKKLQMMLQYWDLLKPKMKIKMILKMAKY